MTMRGWQVASRLGPAVAVAVVLAGCGTTGQIGETSGSGGTSFADRVSRMFASGASSPEPAPEDAGKTTHYECPMVTVRTGAAAHQVFATTRDAGQQLRYQATFGQTARECAALGQMMTMKVGVEGRLLAGQAGGPGKVDIPLRIAVVHEGTTPKTVWTRFYLVPAQMPDGRTQSTFLHVEEDVSFPLPKADDLENYVVYVGFDPTGKPEKTGRKAKTSARGG